MFFKFISVFEITKLSFVSYTNFIIIILKKIVMLVLIYHVGEGPVQTVLVLYRNLTKIYPLDDQI